VIITRSFAPQTVARRICAVATICLVVSLTTGCASTKKSTPTVPPKAYQTLVTHPEMLHPSPGEPGGFGWTAPNANMKQYNKVLLDRILVKFDEKSKHKEIDPVTLAGLVEFFRKAIVQALEPQYPVVDKPGPGVLRVQITLFDLVPTNVTESIAVQAVPFGIGGVGEIIMGETDGKGFGSAPYLGHTGIVLELLDSQTNKVIGEFADTQFGKQYVIDMNKGMSASMKEGTDAYFKGFSTWGYAKEAFDQWAQFFRKRLDQLRTEK
jgi:hypothetical protein